MADETTRAASEPLRFDGPGATAGDAGGAAGGMTCSKCSTPIGAYYYEAGGAAYCARCKRVAEEAMAAGGGSGFARAVVFGGGTALVCAILYALFIQVTHFNIGIIAIGVAALVATAILKGSRGRRGRRYQLLAVGLTYLSVSAARLPFVAEGVAQAAAERAHASARARADSGASYAATDADDDEQDASDAAPAAEADAAGAKAHSESGSIAAGVLGIAILLLIAPAISLGGGMSPSIFGIIIVGYSLLQAWRMTAGPDAATANGAVFTGPYKMGALPLRDGGR